MKFLLAAVNAKYIHSNPAIYSLRAYVGDELMQHVELAEYTINQYMQEILADIYHRKPDAIGFSCYIWNWKLVQELLLELPKLLPDVKLWLGGPEVTYDADAILRQYPQLAGIMVGEGEQTFKELLAHYVQGRSCNSLEAIGGLCLHSGFTPTRTPADISAIPFLYQDLKPFENRIIYYESSRGCPYRCSYCLSSIDKSVRFRNMETVKKELQFFLDNKVKQVKFVDRTFNCNHEHTMAVWRYIYEHDNGVTNFHFEISADILTEEEIALLNLFRPGLAQLEIGVQSVNPETLRAIRRVMNVEKLEKTVAAVRKAGNVHLHLDLIAGLPFEDYQSFSESFNRVYAMRPEQLQLGFLKVLKGSGMWSRAEDYDIRFMSRPPYEALSTKWLSYQEMLRLKQIEEMVELYYNSAQFTHTMPFLEKVFESSFAMYEALAEFYKRKGFSAASPARARRYDLLLAFASEYDGKRQAVYRELLTYDMYLRENMKSRPQFATELSPYRESVREFYQREERERRFLPDYAGYDWKQLNKMTHLEPFVYPVWDMERMLRAYHRPEECADGEGRVFVLFNYHKRSPLNYEAETVVITGLPYPADARTFLSDSAQ